MAQDGAAAFLPLTSAADAPGGEPSFGALTSSASAPGGVPTLVALTSTGEASGASVAGSSVFADLLPMTSAGAGSAGSVAAGAPSFEAMTSTGSTPGYTDAVFEPIFSTGTALAGTASLGSAQFRPLASDAFSVGGSVASGLASFQPLVTTAVSVGPAVASGAPSFRRMQASGLSVGGTVAVAAAVFEPLDISAAGYQPSVGQGAASFQPVMAYASASPAVDSTYRTWSMNASNNALTQYQNYSFNSYADFAGSSWAAGPSGIMRLDGTDDDGAPIAWSFSTGLHDDKKAVLKRLEEVLLSVRFDGPMRVRVWTDDAVYFDYNVANHRADVVHQVRAKLGRGAKSRYFRVELSAMGTTSAEVSTMQLPMIPTQRRLG